MSITLRIDEERVLHPIDPMIYGQFIEHFGRLVYGGLFDPGHPLSDEDGFRSDVLQALRALRVPVIRWPGGCFASAYHWKDGIGPVREPVYDKAWCVEEPNTFGTDEFMLLCRKLEAEPYLCTNAGTGTPEEMADWVEYCNEPRKGRWARARTRNGHERPWSVRYWSIGNENYTGGELGAKTVAEWGPYVRECAKMMRRVDPTIRLFAAAVPDLDWDLALLRSAGDLLDYISIHGYFDPCWQTGILSGYRKSLQAGAAFERDITRTESILRSLGLQDRVKIAFDEWNLRGWYHPGICDFSMLDPDHDHAASLREKAEDDSRYTMADAVFAATFLCTCMRHGDMVRMANFSPAVCGRGMIGVKDDTLVLRPTYHVFRLLRERLGDRLADSYFTDMETCDADSQDVPALDAAATLDSAGRSAICVIGRDPERSISLRIESRRPYHGARVYTICGGPDSCNTIEKPDTVTIRETRVSDLAYLTIPPCSVSVIVPEE